MSIRLLSPLVRIVLTASVCLAWLVNPASPQDIKHIWSPRYDRGVASPQGDCFFRKKFTLINPEQAELLLSATDDFKVFINGKKATEGQSYGELIQLDVSRFVEPGVNLIAIQVKHLESSAPGLAARFSRQGDRRDTMAKSCDRPDLEDPRSPIGHMEVKWLQRYRMVDRESHRDQTDRRSTDCQVIGKRLLERFQHN